MNEAADMDAAPAVSGRKATEMFEASEAPFDLVSMLVDGGVVRDAYRAVPPGRNNGVRLHVRDARS